MSSERKVDASAIMIIIISLIGIILLFATDFAAFYYPGYGPRYSCIAGCEHYTNIDLAAQIIMIILFLIQMVIGINDLVPKRFLNFEKLNIIGLILSGLTVILAMIGLGAFGIYWGFISGFEWWPEAAFIGGIVAALINAIFFVLRFKNII